jgi:hypothetical protein
LPTPLGSIEVGFRAKLRDQLALEPRLDLADVVRPPGSCPIGRAVLSAGDGLLLVSLFQARAQQALGQ